MKQKEIQGKCGYMSPEYVVNGLFSTKSDVFSFGVLVLEIVSGKRNRGFFHPDHHLNLLGHKQPQATMEGMKFRSNGQPKGLTIMLLP
ncbi:G-type lectin S-receptor-like serine/threonine-protein kinase At4g27290 [Camellia sinensis]|uniref:G-type lectin S-receptor-like serine/threonine-protein kinase At4g27290 n=1 Tax=Camellia sinensis TaxID=4442 RepID=UPI00103629C7|nr:G-type lectin S-receptor-like serine/threonine-protein kinase At4g27290 [Camellia sinensis]